MKNTKKKADKNRMKALESYVVTIPNFLSKILGLKDEELLQGELTHKDLKMLFPDLKRSSFDAILDDPGMVYTGKVILVQDSIHNLAPYFNKGVKTLESYGIDSVMDKDEWNQNSDSWNKREKTKGPRLQEYDLSSMSIYELEELLKIYNSTHQKGCYERVRRELLFRKDSRQNSVKSKQKALKKEKRRNKKDDE